MIEGVPPSPRGGHSATLWEVSIVVFGGHYYAGKHKGYKYLNDTYILNVNTNRWSVIFIKNRKIRYQELLLLQGIVTLLSWLDPES